jgi:molybdate transport system substrate-binding protein
VPIGNYARQSLAKLAADPAYGAGFDQKVLANLKSNEPDVKGVVSKVQLGEADAGIVYATDAASAAGKVDAIPIRGAPIATYPIGALTDNGQPFVDFVLSAPGERIMQHYGFLPP